MIRDRRDFLTLGIGALAVSVVPAVARRRPTLVRRSIPVMGTVADLAVFDTSERWAHRALDAAAAELRRVEATMSRFTVTSDVGRLNLSPDRWVSVSAETAAVVSAAVAWSEASDGRFDPALARVSEVWDVSSRTEPPEAQRLVRMRGAGLWRAVQVEADTPGPRIRLAVPEAAVDLGGIAKGYAVDAAAQALRDHGVHDGLVNVGGDLVALGGDPTGSPWSVGIRAPDDPDRVIEVVTVSDGAVATSGDYLQYFQHGGRRYHHLIDPVTAAPRRTPMRSLTVQAERCMDADAAATALFGCPGPLAQRVSGRVGRGVEVIHKVQESSA